MKRGGWKKLKEYKSCPVGHGQSLDVILGKPLKDFKEVA